MQFFANTSLKHHYFYGTVPAVPIFVLNHLPESSIKSSLPYKQPGPVSTLIYIAVGHLQQATLWWK